MSKRNNQQAQNTAVETNAVETPAPVVVEVVSPTVEPVAVEPAVEAPVWQPAANYAKTVENTIARSMVAPHSPAGATAPQAVHVLLSHTTPTVRPGTARAAALAALQASIGQPRPAVLAAVTLSELQWHKANGRTPGNLAPTGWLRTFNAVFGPAPVAVEAPVEAAAVEA